MFIKLSLQSAPVLFSDYTVPLFYFQSIGIWRSGGYESLGNCESRITSFAVKSPIVTPSIDCLLTRALAPASSSFKNNVFCTSESLM